jgi:hypothetical protein
VSVAFALKSPHTLTADVRLPLPFGAIVISVLRLLEPSMLYCVSGLRRRRLISVSLALISAGLVAGCSGEGGLVPPGEVLELTQSAPVMRAEAAAPVISPVLSSNRSVSSGSAFMSTAPSGPDMPAQNVLAYPVGDGVDVSGVTSALPEGRVSQPVVTGIGTDQPQLAGVPSYQELEAAGTPDSVSITPVEPVTVESEPEPIERKPRLFAGLLPRISNPLAKPEWAGGMPAAEKACRQRLKRLGVTYRDLPAINNGPGCSIPHPVEVTRLSGGIEIKPAAKLNCQITDAFAQWVKNELAPAARVRYVSGVKSIHQMSSYSCRTMNSKRGAPMSEHASGNAIDIGKITLNNGKAIKVRQPGLFAFREKSLLNTVRADSCKYFTTVLGPGSDVHHKDHFHFDLRTRKSSYRHCD